MSNINYSNLINNLRCIIDMNLKHMLHGKRCVLLEVPHHQNIGDILIWQGEIDFLKSCGAKCLYQHSLSTFDFRPIKKDVIILLQGGGNFGDIWFHHHQFRRKVLEKYPDNEIIIFPVTVGFDSLQVMKEDIDIFAQHKHVTICARDKVSYKILTENYKNNVVLVPDMAFYINRDFLISKSLKPRKKDLFFKRTDKEYVDSNSYTHYVPVNSEQRDWPTFEKRFHPLIDICYNKIICHIPIWRSWYWRTIMKPYYIKLGVHLMSQYEHIYTTRLHGAILSIILGKRIVFFDNSYSKNLNFYNSWLKDEVNITFVSQLK